MVCGVLCRCRDPVLFASVVRPLLLNKALAEREFMDCWLLDDSDLVARWNMPDRHDSTACHCAEHSGKLL